LIQQFVSSRVVYKFQSMGVKTQRTVELQSYGSDVYQGAASETVGFVEGKGSSCTHTFQEVGFLLFRFREIGQFQLPVGNVATESGIDVSVGTGYVGRIGVSVIVTPKYYLAAVLIRIRDAAPGANGIVVLLRGIYVYPDGAFVVFAQDVLYGVHVMLSMSHNPPPS